MKTNKNTIQINNNTKSANVPNIKNANTPKSSKRNAPKHTPKQTRIVNWTNYNISLVERGLVLQIAKDAIKESKLKKCIAAGHPEEYADAIIQAMAIYREMFNLTLRQAEGFARDIFSVFGIKVPSYATLQRRMSKLNITSAIDRRRLRGETIALVDSTGLKAAGEGEWKVRKHGASKRRTWTKVHYLVDYKSFQVLGVLVTGDYYGDNLAVQPLLEQLPSGITLNTLIGDGAYGTRALYRLVEEDYDATLISPPPKNAKTGKYKEWKKTRDKYVKDCNKLGREVWKKNIDYHRRSVVETHMYRVKSAFTDKLKSRTIKNQRIEVLIRTMLLNKWTNKYMPTYT